ncbi:MAG: hypothetical protein K2J64_08690 [Desulfovibrio sp.]|nr:hypothetical protein [Desulfovibrio sp.]
MQTNNDQLVPFAFGDNLVRVLRDENGEPWFVAKDVALALGYEWNGKACIAHVPDEWRVVRTVLTTFGEKDTWCLSEPGLYFFLGRSDKPGALPFQKWLAGDVLPSLRKTGRYEIPGREGVPSCKTPMPVTLPPEALVLRPAMRQRLWQDALQTARLDGGDSASAQEWFAFLCRMVSETPPKPDSQLLAFMDACLVEQRGASSPAHRIYAALRLWWRECGQGLLPTEKALARALDSRFAKRKSSHMTYLDCAIRPEWRGSARKSRA